MMPRFLLPVLLAFTALTAGPAQAQTDAPPPANAADVESVDAILSALYDVISGPAGEARDWDRFRSLFAPGARLIPVRAPESGGAALLMMTPEDYIARSGPYLEKNGFFEREIARTSEQYGHMVHAFSTYESLHTPDDEAPFARGINSIQLFHDGARWWVVSVYWDQETPARPLPTRYLE